jgi:two-component system OmpR family response regulator
LLVEDDLQLAHRLSGALTEAGFIVEHAADGEAAWYLGNTEIFDVVVLDLGLSKLPGLEVLKRWRAAGRDMPVLVLTGRHAWTERVEGLNAGADDYVGKPFQTQEVIARLRALIRRSGGASGPILRLGELVLDTAANAASLAGKPIELTARELKILGYLMLRQGRIVSQSDIIDHVYSLDDAYHSNSVEVHIGRLRKKIGPDLIKTIRGLGYRLG